MNYAYYKKLKSNLKKENLELTKEIYNESNKVINSYWKYTDACKLYIKCLRVFKLFNKLQLRFLKNIFFKLIYIFFDKKIRVVFFVNEYSTFPAIKSVYDEMNNDKSFMCDLVHIPFNHSNKTNSIENEINDYYENGYNEIIESDDYDLTKKSPDIVIYLKPYDLIPKQFYIDEIEKVVDRIIYIPYGVNTVDDEEIYKYAYSLPIENKSWMYVSHCKHDKRMAEKYSINRGKNFFVIGHPKMDLIYEDLSNKPLYQDIIKRANGRKIFLYNPHHSVNENYKWGTFKLFGLDILKYFNDNKDVFLIYRPHPLLYGALQKEYSNNKEFFKKYEKLLDSENIFYDNTGDYLVSMHLADYMISDANSFVSEFTFYNKPVIYTMFPNNNKICNKDLKSIIYVARNLNETFNYIEKLKNDIDPLKQKRIKKIKTIFKYDENNRVCNKIVEIIKKEFYN